MARRQMYVQFELSKRMEGGGVARMVSWIRQEVALPGRLLRGLEDTDTGRIESGWRVDSAAGTPMPGWRAIQRRTRSRKRRLG